MQNNFSIIRCDGFSQKILACLLLGSILLLPASLYAVVQHEEKTDSSKSKLSKKSKVKKITDLRILVDISGSMKNTDPNNLRRSAIRLLASLIPDGSRAGIWNFGKQVNMAVKIGTVDEKWKKSARSESKKINSVGLYTNIESALRKVSFDWKKEDPRYERNLILLTDGYVDVSNDSEQDDASRGRILKDVIPKLEAANVKIHTIGLSDDVDERLLTTLSAYTDGLYKKVKSASDLQKLFLQMLEQSVKLDTLPIKGNLFNVDASINDMTLLVFNKDKTHPTAIITPEKNNWKKSSRPDQVKWFSDEGYDLITIKKPQQGEWEINAPSDKNNRVVVVTNLKLKLNDIPSSIMLGDKLKISAYLEEDEKVLSDKNMLSNFDFVLTRSSKNSSEKRYPMKNLSGDGYNYTVQIAPIFKLGNNELVIQAKSPTVEREIHHQFTVYAKDKLIVVPEKHASKPNHQEKNVKDKHEDIKKKVHAKKEEKHKDKNKSANIHKDKPENVHKDKSKSEHVTEGDEEKVKEFDWNTIIIAIVVGNFSIMFFVVGGYIYIKKRKAKLTSSIEEEMAGESKEKEESKDDTKEKDNSKVKEKDKGKPKEKVKEKPKEEKKDKK